MIDRPNGPIQATPRGLAFARSMIVRFLAAFLVGGVLAFAIRWAWSFHWSIGAVAAYVVVLAVVVLFFGAIYARRGRKSAAASRR